MNTGTSPFLNRNTATMMSRKKSVNNCYAIHYNQFQAYQFQHVWKEELSIKSFSALAVKGRGQYSQF
jgi:hypothetical protein